MNAAGRVGRKHLIVGRTADAATTRTRARDVAGICDWLMHPARTEREIATRAHEMRLYNRAPVSTSERERRRLARQGDE